MNIGAFKLYFSTLHNNKKKYLFDYLFTSYWGLSADSIYG